MTAEPTMQQLDEAGRALRETLDRLAEPFGPEAIGKKPIVVCQACEHADGICAAHVERPCDTCGNTLTEAHEHLDFVGHAHVRQRFNEVDPNWNWRPLARTGSGLPVFDDYRGLWIELTIGGKTMLGYGNATSRRGGGDAVKECIGNALRNAGQSFGVALTMWMREPLRVVEPVKPRPADAHLTDEQLAKRLRKEITSYNHGKGKPFGQTVGGFKAWTKGEHEFREAPPGVLARYLEHLKAS
ncbi:hypothetical protein ACFORH_42800 [Amycolatopsis roodepoortensis]|uniref:Uncharacterized protein n=1 Tax=Amycolatopsis roodepoortensis TaxID=700274 RepID=A0ABR9L3A8_9PSEU|nr:MULTISPECIES: hypothetical protein [Amycolatopsis]MBE1575025.1 hypothetical protein [Amycolatopsis roodepoortensis]GHG97432.1 hypothetical protein GCM10017788_76930 [Amycolatopsis acidiphila]